MSTEDPTSAFIKVLYMIVYVVGTYLCDETVPLSMSIRTGDLAGYVEEDMF